MLFLQLNGGMIKEYAALGAQTNRLATASSGDVPKDLGGVEYHLVAPDYY